MWTPSTHGAISNSLYVMPEIWTQALALTGSASACWAVSTLLLSWLLIIRNMNAYKFFQDFCLCYQPCTLQIINQSYFFSPKSVKFQSPSEKCAGVGYSGPAASHQLHSLRRWLTLEMVASPPVLGASWDHMARFWPKEMWIQGFFGFFPAASEST